MKNRISEISSMSGSERYEYFLSETVKNKKFWFLVDNSGNELWQANEEGIGFLMVWASKETAQYCSAFCKNQWGDYEPQEVDFDFFMSVIFAELKENENSICMEFLPDGPNLFANMVEFEHEIKKRYAQVYPPKFRILEEAKFNLVSEYFAWNHKPQKSNRSRKKSDLEIAGVISSSINKKYHYLLSNIMPNGPIVWSLCNNENQWLMVKIDGGIAFPVWAIPGLSENFATLNNLSGFVSLPITYSPLLNNLIPFLRKNNAGIALIYEGDQAVFIKDLELFSIDVENKMREYK